MSTSISNYIHDDYSTLGEDGVLYSMINAFFYRGLTGQNIIRFVENEEVVGYPVQINNISVNPSTYAITVSCSIEHPYVSGVFETFELEISHTGGTPEVGGDARTAIIYNRVTIDSVLQIFDIRYDGLHRKNTTALDVTANLAFFFNTIPDGSSAKSIETDFYKVKSYIYNYEVSNDSYINQVGGGPATDVNTGRASGDPYLRDINGDLMKLPDANQKYTLFETENSQLKVEFTTTLLNPLQKVQYWSQCKKFFPQLQNKAISRDNLLRTFEAPLCFIQNVIITHDNKTETYNLFRNLGDCVEIVDAENGAGIEKRIAFMVDNKEVVIKLQKFSNPQIITGLSYVIPKSVKVRGLITDASSRKYKVIQERFIIGNCIKNVTMKQLF